MSWARQRIVRLSPSVLKTEFFSRPLQPRDAFPSYLVACRALGDSHFLRRLALRGQTSPLFAPSLSLDHPDGRGAGSRGSTPSLTRPHRRRPDRPVRRRGPRRHRKAPRVRAPSHFLSTKFRLERERPRCCRSLIGVVSRLVDLRQPDGLVSKAGRIIAAKTWAEEISTLKATLGQTMARWQVHVVRLSSCF